MISIIGFAAVLLVIAICCFAPPRSRQNGMKKSGRLGAIRKLLYLLSLLCFFGLVITGFYPVIVLSESISGYWLILHVCFAPVFAASLAVLSVMWAGNCSLRKGEPNLQKICFWLIIFLVIPVILSIVLSMFNFFGTTAQELLLQVHRYGALFLALIVIVHTYLIICFKREQ
jgi:thiosulfate reductase cytochrome b subunit